MSGCTLVDHFLRRFAAETQAPAKVMSREAMDVLVKYHYPGAAASGAGRISDATSFVERVTEFERALIVEALECGFCRRG